MRKLTYIILHAVGPGSARKKGTLVNLVLAIPYLISGCSNGGFIPPLRVLNDVFKKGDGEAGMSGGCKWEPFEIDEEEYKDLVKALRRIKDKDYRLLFSPGWVETYSDWSIWMTELFLGVPSKKHRALVMNCKRIERSILEAEVAGNEKLLVRLRIKHLRTEIELANLTNQYILWKQGYGT